MSPRHVFETRIGTGLHRDSQRLTLEGWSRNLSESGRGAFVAQALVPGKFVTLEIPLPDSDKQVTWRKFAHWEQALSAAQRTRIRATLKGHPSVPYHSTGRWLKLGIGARGLGLQCWSFSTLTSNQKSNAGTANR